MKLDLQAKYLQFLNQKKQDEGFTLIELLVVIIIIGILAAIALPSFLSQANKGKQTEAKTYIGSMNKAQQANFTEKSLFAGGGTQAVQDLGVGIKTETVNYKYQAGTAGTGTGVYASSYSIVVSNAPLKNYLGVVSLIPSGSEYTSVAVLCEEKVALNINSTPVDDNTTKGATCNTSQILVGGTQ